MSAIDDLERYLTSTLSAKLGDAVLSSVIETEFADQRARIRSAHRVDTIDEWELLAAPLREAVCRRCCRNLALRKLPLGIAESEANALRISSRDPEIRRLEAPYLRLVVG